MFCHQILTLSRKVCCWVVSDIDNFLKWGLSGICIGCVFLCPTTCDLFIKKMHIDWNCSVISLNVVKEALFLTLVTLHEDTLLWRIQCIFLSHGFLSIKEIILLPCLFRDSGETKTDTLLYNFFCILPAIKRLFCVKEVQWLNLVDKVPEN